MNRPSIFQDTASIRRIFLLTVLSIQLSCQVFAGIIFNGSPGTAAPPASLGGYSMTPFAPDPRTIPGDVTFIQLTAGCPAMLNFTASGSPLPVHHHRIGSGWATWSHGYTGDVYATSLSVMTIVLPPNTRAFYFYVEPYNFGLFNVSALANDGTTSGVIPVNGNSGARYIGFYSNNPACQLTSISITTPIAASGFAVGEFGINKATPFTGAMVCDDDIQLSLDEKCYATITPDMVIEGLDITCGTPDFEITVTDWVTGAKIDDDLGIPGPQFGRTRIGHSYKVMIMDLVTRNNCWSRVRIEDKQAPILSCPENAIVLCSESTLPTYTGVPSVVDNCGDYTLNYYDIIERGSCLLGYERLIHRHWVSRDSSNNRDTCIQTITVITGPLSEIAVPSHYDGLPGHKPVLLCNQKYDPNFNLTAHILPSPNCVDGYLLDSALWLATGNRVPKVLGWNCIASGTYQGHPNPDPIFYPANTLCWGDNEVIMWFGTGRPANNTCLNIASTYSDVKINLAKDNCDAGDVGCYKILRKWVLVDWCSSQVREYSQIIKVMDTLGPKIVYPDSISVGTEIWLCKGRWSVPAPWITDNCSNEIHYSLRLSYGNVIGDDRSGYIAVDMPLGWQEAWIIAEDCCGNVTEKKIIIDVIDNTSPTAVCEKRTVVSITGNLSPGQNTAKVYAETFDDGSHDNCATHLYYKVIRMDELRGTLNGSVANNDSICSGTNGDDDPAIKGVQVYFDDYVKFCCADAGNIVRVVFRVFDAAPGNGPIPPSWMSAGGWLAGHFTDCMVEVEVQDKTIPTIVAPPDIVISCSFWFDDEALNNPNNPTFGKIVKDLAWRKKVVTTDIVCPNYCNSHPISLYPGFITGLPQHLQPAPNKACDYYSTLFQPSHPDNKYELLWGFDGYVLSPCGIDPIINVEDMRQCGIGKILRNFIARGASGSFVRSTQTIWVVDCDPFYINPEDRCDATDDIIWPNCDGSAVKIEGCGVNTSPDNPLIGKPVIVNGADDLCALIAINYVDERFDIEPDACYKILRKWTVIDWCNYDPVKAPYTGRWSFTQIIKVSDKQSPVIHCETGPCTPAVKNPATGRCMSHLEIKPVAFDSCTVEEWLFYEYKLDLNNDGSFEYRVGSNTKLSHQRGDIPAYRNNPFADDNTKGFDASGTYPIGLHRFVWFVEDGCGNLAKCDTVIRVKDCKAPTPYCLPGVITVPMPSSGCVEIWAKDLDRGSYDNCTDARNLKFYFNHDRTKPSITVCCADFVRERVRDQYVLDVEVWVEDEEGNADFCKTVVIVQDNNNLCPDPTTFTKSNISGLVKTSENKGIVNVDIDLYDKGGLFKSNKSSSAGFYAFYDLNVDQDYVIKPVANNDYLNGVSTADIVKMQKHILGQELIVDPYILIAADVNKSGTITAADLSEIRKLILGNVSKFNKLNSWVFIPSDFHFADPSAPYNYPTEKNVKTVEETMNANFVGVKIGDINLSAKLNFNAKSESRSDASLLLNVEDKELSENEDYTMEIRSDNFQSISGMQFTLQFDASKLKYNGISSSAIHIDDNNIGINDIQNGRIAFSWNENGSKSVNRKDVLFKIHFIAISDVKIQDAVIINSTIAQAEAYNTNLDIMNVQLVARNSQADYSTFILYQNVPNPFKDATSIQFYTPSSMDVKLSIYDMSGKMILYKELESSGGLNSIKLNKNKFPSAGIYYYRLDSNNATDTKRLVLID